MLTVYVIVHYKLSTEQSSSLSSYTLLAHGPALQTQQTCSRRYRLLLTGARTPASLTLNLTILRYYVPRLTKTYLPKSSTVQITFYICFSHPLCSRTTIWEIDHTTDNSQNVHLVKSTAILLFACFVIICIDFYTILFRFILSCPLVWRCVLWFLNKRLLLLLLLDRLHQSSS